MLKLRKVQLLGFKSFADKTEITFTGSGVAAVVGPNGCGKSNVSDAIHWVLGEQSAKTLRSGRMQDVLFNGTPTRKATGLAEVRLTLFDPDAPELAEAPAIPSANGNGTHPPLPSEERGIITVSRRLFASGESEYLLNDRACRLRDIQDLFLGTGLGPDSYAIIEQGRIGQILSARPYERRALIEEAAGITKFKAKRKLAWAKLESSKQNLARVHDILQEITKQLNSLQRQAARARRHQELRQQMQSQLRLVLASRAQQTEQQLAQAALELGMLRRTLEEQTSETERRESEQQTLRLALQQCEAELRTATEERTTLRLDAERARGRIATQTEQMRLLEQRIAEATAEQNDLRVRQESLAAEQVAAARAASELEQEAERLRAEMVGWEASVRVCEQDLQAKELQREELGREMLESVGRAAALRNQMEQIERYLATTEKQIAQVGSQLSELRAVQEAAALRRERDVARRQEQTAEHLSVIERRRALEESLSSLRQQESRDRELLEATRTELAGRRARMQSLEQILTRHAYTTETVQRLFDSNSSTVAAAQGSGGEMAATQRFQPVGLLADFVEVEPAYEHVVEEFLRDELEYLVVKDWDAAQHGLHLLQNQIAGRATFLLEASANASSYRNGSGSPPPDGVQPLASCVRFLNGFSGTPAALLPKLERCYLIADPEQGCKLAMQHPDLYFLTPEGMWFQGALVSAGKAGGQGPLALKRELRNLTEAVQSQERDAASAAESLARGVQQIREQQAELDELIGRQQDCEKRLMLAERDEQEAQAESKRLSERAELLSLELETMQRETERSRGQWSDNTYHLGETEKRRVEIDQEIAALQSATAERRVQRDASRQCESELRGRLAGIDERRRSAAQAVERLTAASGELTARRNKLESDCAQWLARNQEWQTECRTLEEQLTVGQQRCEMLESGIARMEASSSEQRLRIQQIEQDAQQFRQALQQTYEAKAAAEVQLARLQGDREHLQQTCRDELGMELEALFSSYESAGEHGPQQPGPQHEAALLGPEELTQAEQQYRELRVKIENMGPINMMALEEFEECRGRRDFLDLQQQDLQDSIADTTKAIAEIDEVCNRQFGEAFQQISSHFQLTFAQLFGGGQGLLRLMQWEDGTEAGKPAGGAEEPGVEIVAQPPGKRLQSVLLLSGGEKALTALALLLAIFRYKPSPFCILDEVDAPLDDANVGRFTQMVQEMSRDTQFILITHSKKTMSIAPVMYGVTMQEPGVSKIVSVRFHNSAAGVEAPPPPTETAVAEDARTLAEAVA